MVIKSFLRVISRPETRQNVQLNKNMPLLSFRYNMPIIIFIYHRIVYIRTAYTRFNNIRVVRICE